MANEEVEDRGGKEGWMRCNWIYRSIFRVAETMLAAILITICFEKKIADICNDKFYQGLAPMKTF